jgi:hypothetical protein
VSENRFQSLITASATTPAAGTPAAATSATTVAAATSATAWPSTATSTTTAAFARRTGLVYDHASAHEVVAIESLNRAAGIVVAIYFDESESARLTREAVAHQSDIRRRDTHLRKPIAQFLFCSLKRQVAHVQFFHERTPLASG